MLLFGLLFGFRDDFRRLSCLGLLRFLGCPRRAGALARCDASFGGVLCDLDGGGGGRRRPALAQGHALGLWRDVQGLEAPKSPQVLGLADPADGRLNGARLQLWSSRNEHDASKCED